MMLDFDKAMLETIIRNRQSSNWSLTDKIEKFAASIWDSFPEDIKTYRILGGDLQFYFSIQEPDLRWLLVTKRSFIRPLSKPVNIFIKYCGKYIKIGFAKQQSTLRWFVNAQQWGEFEYRFGLYIPEETERALRIITNIPRDHSYQYEI